MNLNDPGDFGMDIGELQALLGPGSHRGRMFARGLASVLPRLHRAAVGGDDTDPEALARYGKPELFNTDSKYISARYSWAA